MIGRALLLALALVLPLEAGAQTFPVPGPGHLPWTATGGGGGGGTIFNAASQNIFDTLDPLCNPATASANGIVLCDGNEDGYFGNGDAPGAATDYWLVGSDNGPSCNGCNATTSATDTDDDADGAFANYDSGVTLKNDDFSVCNSGTINTAKANFGAAGTPCAIATGWGRDIAPVHCLKAVGGDPSHCASAGTSGNMSHYYLRFMLKITASAGERCAAGWPSCGNPSFGTNGNKIVEMTTVRDLGGISYVDWSWEGTSTSSLFGFGTDAGDHCGAATNTGKSGFDGFYLQQNQGNTFSWASHFDHWVNVEIMIKYVAGNDASAIKMWIDDCGADGKQCTGTPTLRFSMTNLDMQLDSDCVLPRALWLNGWSLTQGAEYQWDEIVVRDGTVVDAPIGFSPIH